MSLLIHLPSVVNYNSKFIKSNGMFVSLILQENLAFTGKLLIGPRKVYNHFWKGTLLIENPRGKKNLFVLFFVKIKIEMWGG